MYSKDALTEIVRECALEFGEFTLASGKKASYYLDCRKVTLDSRGAQLIARGILELLGDTLPDAVGGMAIGADPRIGADLFAGFGLSADALEQLIQRGMDDRGPGMTVPPQERSMVQIDMYNINEFEVAFGVLDQEYQEGYAITKKEWNSKKNKWVNVKDADGNNVLTGEIGKADPVKLKRLQDGLELSHANYPEQVRHE